MIFSALLNAVNDIVCETSGLDPDANTLTVIVLAPLVEKCTV